MHFTILHTSTHISTTLISTTTLTTISHNFYIASIIKSHHYPYHYNKHHTYLHTSTHISTTLISTTTLTTISHITFISHQISNHITIHITNKHHTYLHINNTNLHIHQLTYSTDSHTTSSSYFLFFSIRTEYMPVLCLSVSAFVFSTYSL